MMINFGESGHPPSFPSNESIVPRKAQEQRMWKIINTLLHNNEQETSEVQFEEYALKLNAGDFASRSKAKTKPQK